jgi:hypothetical protein
VAKEKTLPCGQRFFFTVFINATIVKLIMNVRKTIVWCQRSMIFIIIVLLFSQRLFAQGDLLIYPKRLVFDGSKRSYDINLVNNGSDTARYVISVVQIRMKEDGSFENISLPDSGQYFADKNFRFFPRSVVLGPKEAQTVKVQLLQFSSLPEGEYRSHLYFRAQEQMNPMGLVKASTDSGKISISLTPVYGLSIPIIIRSGMSTTEINISGVHFRYEKDNLPVLEMILNRSGNMSVYGDISVEYLSPEGKETRVAFIKGIAVYTPSPSRKIRLALEQNRAIDYHKGSLHVVFTENSWKVQKVAQQQLFLD